jgi:hypothetical protein
LQAACSRHLGNRQLDDLCEPRSVEAQTIDERINRRGAPLDLDGHAGGGIEDEAGELERCGEVIDEWAKPHTLDDAANVKLTPNLRVRIKGLHFWSLRITDSLPHR